MSEYTALQSSHDVLLGTTVELRHNKYATVTGDLQEVLRSPTSIRVNGAWHHVRAGWTLWVKPEPEPEPEPQPFGIAATTGIWADGAQEVWETQGRTGGISQGVWDEYGPWTELLTGAEWEKKRGERHADLITELRLYDHPAPRARCIALMQSAANALAPAPEAGKP